MIKINHIDGKRVSIIKSNVHTYNVRYLKSGKFAEVYKGYVKTYYIDPKKKTKAKPKTQKTIKENKQQKLNL